MMRFELVLMAEAESDLDDAFIWYELQKPGLGIEFITDVEKVFLFIDPKPKGIRKALSKNTQAGREEVSL